MKFKVLNLKSLSLYRSESSANRLYHKSQGMTTFELLIAMALIVAVITSVIPLISGGQNSSVDSKTNQEALYKAKDLLEKAKSDAKSDFSSVVTTLPATDNIYTKNITVEDINSYAKKVTSNVIWNIGSKNLYVKLTTILTNPLLNSRSCNPNLIGDWTNPQITKYEFGNDILNDTSSGFPITSVQISNQKIYVTVNNNNGNNPGTFYILDVSDPSIKPILLSPKLFDNNLSVGQGLNAVAVDNSNYAYVANAYGANYTTCTNPFGTNYSCGQLQVINITDPTNPIMKYSYKIPGVTGNSGQGIGTSIFYKDGFVYLGLSKATGPEFNIIDVGG